MQYHERHTGLVTGLLQLFHHGKTLKLSFIISFTIGCLTTAST